jgi:hypothetical protein
MTRELDPDFLYRLDQLIANRSDGGTVSDTLSEVMGIQKSELHGGMVGTAGVVAAVKLAKATDNPWMMVLGLALIGFTGKAIYDYMEAPRRR